MNIYGFLESGLSQKVKSLVGNEALWGEMGQLHLFQLENKS